MVQQLLEPWPPVGKQARLLGRYQASLALSSLLPVERLPLARAVLANQSRWTFHRVQHEYSPFCRLPALFVVVISMFRVLAASAARLRP